jgi:hypothetical protein
MSSDLDALVAERAEESLVLEFKRELSLSTKSEKKEVAKDICAMANSSGGWIIYGIDEARTGDDAPIAAFVTPFSDASLAAQLEGIVHGTISPTPLVRIRRIDYGTGSCLVVRVEPASNCVHQVTGYGEYRFYRRSEFSARPMSEPEVRDAFSRVGRAADQAEVRLAQLVKLAQRDMDGGYFLLAIIPQFPREAIDPGKLVKSPVVINTLESAWTGVLSPGPEGATARIGGGYWLHVGRDAAFVMTCPLAKELRPEVVLTELRVLFRLASASCNEFGFHSPWHLAVRIKPANPIPLIDRWRPRGSTVQFDEFLLAFSHVELLADWERPAARAMRRLYQAFGQTDCPMFDSEDRLRENARAMLGNS